MSYFSRGEAALWGVTSIQLNAYRAAALPVSFV